jgi:uncharacterized protein involved in exopolysaccharide biosynthesis
MEDTDASAALSTIDEQIAELKGEKAICRKEIADLRQSIATQLESVSNNIMSDFDKELTLEVNKQILMTKQQITAKEQQITAKEQQILELQKQRTKICETTLDELLGSRSCQDLRYKKVTDLGKKSKKSRSWVFLNFH